MQGNHIRTMAVAEGKIPLPQNAENFRRGRPFSSFAHRTEEHSQQRCRRLLLLAGTRRLLLDNGQRFHKSGRLPGLVSGQQSPSGVRCVGGYFCMMTVPIIFARCFIRRCGPHGAGPENDPGLDARRVVIPTRSDRGNDEETFRAGKGSASKIQIAGQSVLGLNSFRKETPKGAGWTNRITCPMVFMN